MPLKTIDDPEPSLNLTSMIDVLFLLVIFFMAASKFTELERKIGLKVPQVADGKNMPSATSRQTVSVYRDGSVALGREVVSLPQLTQRLRQLVQLNPGLGVVVRGDGEASFQPIADVLAACRQAGVADMGITVRVARAAATATATR